MGGRNYTAKELREAERLRLRGWSWAQIGRKLGRNGSAINKAVVRRRPDLRRVARYRPPRVAETPPEVLNVMFYGTVRDPYARYERPAERCRVPVPGPWDEERAMR